MPKQSQEDIEDDTTSGYSSETLDLLELTSFNQSQKPSLVRSVRWHSSEDRLLSVDNKVLATWDVASGKVCTFVAVTKHINLFSHFPLITAIGSFGFGLQRYGVWRVQLGERLCGVGSSFGTAVRRGVRLLVAAAGHARDGLHRGAAEGARRRNHQVSYIIGFLWICVISARDVDYNPNKAFALITAGDDRKVKFWDARNLDAPVKTLAGHSHWAWCAKYNPYHDQLVVRCCWPVICLP